MAIDGSQKDNIDVEFDGLINKLEISVEQLEENQKVSFETIQKTNKTIISKIEQQKIEFAKKITDTKSRFKTVYNSGIRHINNYKTTVNNILGNLIEFELMLIILLLPNIWELFVSIFPQYASIIPIPAEYAKWIFIIQSTGLFLAIIIFYRRINRDNDNLKSENLINLEESLKTIEELQNVPYDVSKEIDTQKGIITDIKYSVLGSVAQVKDSIPIYKQIHEDDKFRKKWDLICDKQKNVLKFFGFNKIELQISELKRQPNYSIMGYDDHIQEKEVIRNLSDSLKFDQQIFSLLSDCYNGESTDNQWHELKTDAPRLQIISKILLNSKHLDVSNQKITENELLEILQKSNRFDISLISKNCVLYLRILDYFENYRERLKEEGIILNNKLTNLEIIKAIDFSGEFQDNFLNIFSTELDNYLGTGENKQIRNALLAILLNRDINFKRKTCQNASDDVSVLILLGYHELSRKKQEQNQHFQLSDLLENTGIFIEINDRLDANSDSYDAELFDRFQFFKTSLTRGNWFDNEIFLMRAMLLTKFAEVDKSLHEAKKYHIIQKIIEKNFENININIVEKAIDANLFSTYVIMTDAREGEFRNIINKLSIRDTTSRERKLPSEIQEIEKEYGISLLKNGKPKYDFVNYSRGTKVGVLDRKVLFTDFKVELMSDVAKILEKEKGPWNIGLSVVRITPSKYSFGIPDDQFEKLPNVETKDLEIVKIITKLARNYLEDSEKAVITHFDKNIDMLEIINQQSILNLISYEGMDLSVDYRRFLNSSQLKNALFLRLKEEEISNFKELAIAIHRKHVDRKKILTILDEVISIEYQNQFYRSLADRKLNEFSIELVKSLDSIALLWDK